MKRKGITLKLFLLTVVVFMCFYGMIILAHMLFFQDFYQKYKIKGVESALERFSEHYVNEDWSSHRASREAVKFMSENKSQLTIVDMDGDLTLNDPYHITLKQQDGTLVVVSLSFFMNTYGQELKAAAIDKGSTLTVWGALDQEQKDSPTVMYPFQITQKGFPSIGEDVDASYADKVTGEVVERVLPRSKAWNTQQGLLFDALNELFPLKPSQEKKVKDMKLQKIDWTEPWSGTHNMVIIDPVKTKAGKTELLVSVTSLQEVQDTNNALQLFYLYLGIGGLFLIIILSFFFSRLVSKPLIKLDKMAKRMVKLDFTVDSPVRQKDEIGNLSNSMLLMARNLDQALKELEEKNVQLLADMEQKNEMEKVQQDFFANASHELKTPLSIIKSFAEGLKDGIGANKQDHYFEVIVEEAEKMEGLLTDMLDLAKLEARTIKLRKTSFLLSDLMDKASNKLVYSLKEKDLDVVIGSTKELPIVADYGWMEKVMLNFLVNSIRHAKKGSTISIDIESDDHDTTFILRNRGDNIPEDTLDHIWKRFYRGELSRSRQTGGTGLGLSIAQQILDMHHCEYKVENLEDGVQFTILFTN
ncbi:sensor histidine kinase [Rossellomorea marisflavi]|uniref:histidine kinase n=1 Tax=Rossellomorea marisflavi TaxID=189381 RepID=A0A165L4V5_9BACI|nr:HAMP domain-containing sensor histidine kinase [Rossellomorea marisflavi]KZE51022.1 histidine kinase [Rossellomorea marisflavi]TYO68755.1 HAMP domain-containing histidine kinase [Rossellomorea marisflavi]